MIALLCRASVKFAKEGESGPIVIFFVEIKFLFHFGMELAIFVYHCTNAIIIVLED